MNTPNPNPHSNPQTTPDKQQTAPEKQSPVNPDNPNNPSKDSAPKMPETEGDKQGQDRSNQDKQDRTVKPQGSTVSAVAVAGILAFTGMGLGALNTVHADPVTPAVASEYCTQLADQFDKSLSLHNASEHLDEANRGRSLGWNQCTQGNVSQGEMTLKTAIRDLGVRPLVKDTPTRK